MRVSTDSSVATAVVLHGVRCLSSRSGSGGGRRVGRRPAEKRQRASAEAKDDAEKEKEKESYTFLEEEDLGRLSSESKVSQGVEFVVFMHNMLMCWACLHTLTLLKQRCCSLAIEQPHEFMYSST